MVQPLPSLSTAGYVQDPAQVLDRLLSYFFIADYSQSNEHRGKVASLPYIIKESTNRPQQLARQTQTALQNLLDSYFEHVDITVDVTENTQQPESYDIKFMGTVTSNGRTYTVAKLVSVTNDKLAKTSTLLTK